MMIVEMNPMELLKGKHVYGSKIHLGYSRTLNPKNTQTLENK
jgi:hypothetical protein